MKRFLAVVVLALLACGGGGYGGGSTSGGNSTPPAAPPQTSGFTITIQNLSFSPLNLDVPPGAVVTVANQDGMAHSVTSEAAPRAFTPGGVGGVSFDTGDFASGTRTFTVPANAVEGTVVPYYCRTHLGTMATPTGTITVRSSATASTPPTPPAPVTPPGY